MDRTYAELRLATVASELALAELQLAEMQAEREAGERERLMLMPPKIVSRKRFAALKSYIPKMEEKREALLAEQRYLQDFVTRHQAQDQE